LPPRSIRRRAIVPAKADAARGATTVRVGIEAPDPREPEEIAVHAVIPAELPAAGKADDATNAAPIITRNARRANRLPRPRHSRAGSST